MPDSKKMSAGPSPVMPLLLVGALGTFIYWEELMNGLELFSEVQESTLALVVILPVLLLLVVVSMAEIIVIPLVLLIVLVVVLRNVLVGLLTVLLTVALLGKFYYPSEPRPRSSGCEDEGNGLVWFLLMSVFLFFFALFYEGAEYGWISLIVVLGFTLFFNMLEPEGRS